MLSKKKKKKKKKDRRVNRVEIDLNDPCVPIEIPDDIEHHQLFCVQMYRAGINAAKKGITKFTNGMDCVIYSKKHMFDQCPVLNDIPYIKKHFISYCILMNRTQEKMFATIHPIDANLNTDINNNNNNDGEDYLHGNIDNDADFQEEEE